VARSLARRALGMGLLAGVAVWSCSSSEPHTTASGGATGSGGAPAGSGGSASDAGAGGLLAAGGSGGLGGTAGNAGNAGNGVGGNSFAGGSSPSDGGAAPEGGMGGSVGGEAGQSGASDGGAAGSADIAPDFAGLCGQGWAATRSSAPPPLRGTITPQVDSAGNWSFNFGRYRFVVAAKHGARIIEFSLDGVNLIDATGGSTFWPSPQQAYPWPPPAQIDTAAYAAESDATSLTLISDVATTIGLSARKRFWVNASSGVVSIEYQLINESPSSASWAPWEVTRVRAGGYTFAPKGPGTRAITQDSFQNPLPLSLLPPAPAASGIQWLNYPSLKLTQDNYIVEFDGAEGWLAHANRFGTKLLPVLFVKSFSDAPDASLPTNQAEIQLWTSGTANPKLIEVEEQGAQQTLLPGESLSWTVHWSACELPSSSLLAAGNVDLARLARAHAVPP